MTHARQSELAGWKKVSTGIIPPAVDALNATTPELPFAIFENETVLPRAFIIGNVTASGDALAKEGVSRLRDLNSRESVLLPRDVWGNVPRATFAAATIERYSSNEVLIQATADGHGYLVLTDLFHPGWSATVDGQPTNILPADLSFRAVPLTPGEHRITFRFSPPGWHLGALVSIVSWLGAIMLPLFHRRRVSRESRLSQCEKLDVTEVSGHSAAAIDGLTGEATELTQIV